MIRRKLLFTPEIGDWTTYTPENTALDISIGAVGVSKFDRVSKEDFIKAHKLHYHVYEKLMTYLMDILKIKVDLYSVIAQQIAFGDFFKQYSESVLQASVSISGQHAFKIYVSHLLATSLMDRSLGGEGRGAKDPLSELEHQLFTPVLDRVLEPFLAIWDVDREQVTIDSIASNVEEDLSLTPQNTFIVYSAKYGIGTSEPGLLMVGYPSESVTQILSKYDNYVKRIKQKNVILKPSTQEKINVPVRVEIGSAYIAMIELLSLAEGDVIALDTQLNDHLQGTIGDNLYIKGFPGEYNGKYSLQLLEVSENPEESYSSFGLSRVSVSKTDKGSFEYMADTEEESDEEIESGPELLSSTEDAGEDDLSEGPGEEILTDMPDDGAEDFLEEVLDDQFDDDQPDLDDDDETFDDDFLWNEEDKN